MCVTPTFQALFEQEDNMEYVYKEPKVTGLTEICERLQTMYTEKFGKGKVRLIMDSGKVRHRSLAAAAHSDSVSDERVCTSYCSC